LARYGRECAKLRCGRSPPQPLRSGISERLDLLLSWIVREVAGEPFERLAHRLLVLLAKLDNA
jgi:hypothetical protein